MKTLKTLKQFSIAILALIFMTSCSDDDGPAPFVPTNSIVELANATPELSDLYSALTKYPDLVNLLSNDGTFTVFAPTNAAFDALLPVIGQASIDDVPEDVLKNVLQYHVFASAAVEASAVTTGAITMANGESAELVADSNGVSIEGAQVILANGIGTNGIVHVIDRVIVPPSILPIVGTIVAPAYFNKNFTTLIAAVQAADPSILELLLSNPDGNGLTLFAPTNDAFTAAGITDLAAVADVVDAVLAYHVVEGTVMADMLPTSGIAAEPVETLGGNIFVTNAGGDVSINGTSTVTTPNISGSNGVVHVIDSTLIPPSMTIAEVVSGSSDFTLLLAALRKANLVGAFDEATDGPYTVFAPTDAAFIAAGFPDVDAINAADVDVLTNILTHHVVKANAHIFSTDLTDDLVATMLNDQNITIDLDTLTIADASGSPSPSGLVATSLNIHTTNGVVHVIDQVLLPN